MFGKWMISPPSLSSLNPPSLSSLNPPQKIKSPEEKKICYTCGNELTTREDYFSIFRKRRKGINLFFHVECFENTAGDEFTKALEVQKKHCRLCSKELDYTVHEKIVCTDCENKFPLCPACSHPLPTTANFYSKHSSIKMQVKINRKNNTLFLGCPNYPSCKKTMNIVP